TQGLPDLLALGADRETLRITTGDPDLAAQRDHRSAHDHRLGQLVLGYIVGEAFVVAVIDPELCPFVDNGVRTGSQLGVAHGSHPTAADLAPLGFGTTVEVTGLPRSAPQLIGPD